MKSKLLICAVLLLSAVGAIGSSYVQADYPSYKVSERLAS
ncbi:Uncharacterised protein [Bacillus paralicheniformis]|nr:Uncharacterised protein [Bacillus paralicheniformis]